MKNLSRTTNINQGRLSRALVYLFILTALVTWTTRASANVSLGEKGDALHYKCEIVSIYARLNLISTEYGEILINEDESVIFQASTEAAGAFNEVRKELLDMHVPDNMKEPQEMLIKSAATYIESARSIEKALGIYLGAFEGTEEETLELVSEGEEQVVLANKYLSQSLAMHDKILAFDEDVSKSCRKYVAGL